MAPLPTPCLQGKGEGQDTLCPPLSTGICTKGSADSSAPCQERFWGGGRPGLTAPGQTAFHKDQTGFLGTVL